VNNYLSGSSAQDNF